ncbi:Neuromedin U receptor [Trichostrongylus colubriformis]|uniref:Neuromedin U receptor n=1 Tax=Trichostrongylus colubriformis TaxID=6319 RepID=A0AAN8IQV9_TRICO
MGTNCDDNAFKCACLALECPRVFNYSVALKEECWMKECFISKRALDQSTLLQVTIGYLVILLIGLIGNTLAIAVLRKHPLMKTHSSIYIINLAVADLITLCVGLPFEVIMNWSQYPWPFPDVFCNLKALIAETTNYVSIITILLFSIERYVAVCHPFIFVNIKPLRQNVHQVLCFAWLVSAVSASPFGFYHRADYILKDWPGTNNHVPVLSSKMCMVAVLFDRSSKPMYKFIFHLSALLFFVIPLSIIFVLHVLIAIHVRSSRKDINRADSVDDGNVRLTLILVSIVCALFVCHLPFQIQRLSFFYLENEQSVSTLNQYLFFISGFLFYLAPIVNPILYNVVSVRFRKASKDVLSSLFYPSKRRAESIMLKRSSVKYIIASRGEIQHSLDAPLLRVDETISALPVVTFTDTHRSLSNTPHIPFRAFISLMWNGDCHIMGSVCMCK